MESIGARYLNDLQRSTASSSSRQPKSPVATNGVSAHAPDRCLSTSATPCGESLRSGTVPIRLDSDAQGGARSGTSSRQVDQQIAHSETPGPSPAISAQSTPNDERQVATLTRSRAKGRWRICCHFAAPQSRDRDSSCGCVGCGAGCACADGLAPHSTCWSSALPCDPSLLVAVLQQ